MQTITLGDVMRIWRATRRLNQHELAVKLRVGRDRVVRLENGYAHPTASELSRMRKLGIQVEA